MPIKEPSVYDQHAQAYHSNGPRLHEFLREIVAETMSKYECVLETPSRFGS